MEKVLTLIFVSEKKAVSEPEKKPDKIRNIIGVNNENLPNNKILSILEKLEFSVDDNDAEWIIKVPAHRISKDVSIASDIIEEVGRIYGYNSIEPKAP